jgi:filamentous hemagglutinin
MPRSAQTKVARAIVRRLRRISGKRVRFEVAGKPRAWNRHLNWRRRTEIDASGNRVRRTGHGWEPDTIYRVYNPKSRSDYVYMTDRYGRVTRAEGQLVLNPAYRHTGQQRMAGGEARRSGDEGGHLFGTQFGGAGEGINVLPQSARLNSQGQREWWRMEQSWADELRAGNQVHVKIVPKYRDDGDRPAWFKVTYTITRPNGTTETITRVFNNTI